MGALGETIPQKRSVKSNLGNLIVVGEESFGLLVVFIRVLLEAYS